MYDCFAGPPRGEGATLPMSLLETEERVYILHDTVH
jgi:hypothetical protein